MWTKDKWQAVLNVFHLLRRHIYKIIEVAQDGNLASEAYDRLMIVCIIVNILPLCFKESNIIFDSLEQCTLKLFIVDYFLRWLTADFRHPNWWKGTAFLRHPFTFFAIVDLLSILPSIPGISQSFRLFRLFRLVKSLKTLRLLRYSTGFRVIYKTIQKQRDPLLAVLWMALGYIFLAAVIMFSVEPQTFPTFFDAIYWSAVTLTTVGYGDIYPTSDIGRLIGMISSFIGIAIVALPTGIISAGFMNELEQHYSDKDE